MGSKSEGRGPQFVRYFGPVIDVLNELGGSASPDEVRAKVAAKLKLPDEALDEQTSSGGSRFDNQVAWARFYLVKAKLIDSSRRGVWSLTDEGRLTQLDHTTSLKLFKTVHAQFTERGPKDEGATAIEASDKKPEKQVPPDDSPAITPIGHHAELLSVLQSLSAGGFERFCMRLLRESGFQQLEVTGRSGDGGIDGNGILKVNPLMSFRVLFQSKRYKGSIPPSQLRDFRGAMMGRADKGIFLTTGTFTREARKEAVRDGAPPIELVDAEKMMEMLESLELGVRAKTAYEVDHEFFEEFK